MGSISNDQKYKKMYGTTPLQFAINQFIEHTRYIYHPKENINNLGVATVIKNFTYHFHEHIIKIIESKTNYKNNIIKYLDLIYPQLLLIYNNLLFSNLAEYRYGWTYDDMEDLKGVLNKYSMKVSDPHTVPLINIKNYSAVKSSVSYNTLNFRATENLDKINAINDQLKMLNAQIDNLIKDRNRQINTVYVNVINNKIDNINLKKTNLQNEKNLLSGNNYRLDYNLRKNMNINMTQLDNRIKNFQTTNDFYDLNPLTLYNNIFTKVIVENNVAIHKDYFLYNKLWQDLINDNSRLIDIRHIHIICLILQYQIIERVTGENLTKELILEIKNDMKPVLKIYKNIFKKIVIDISTLPNKYSILNPNLKNIIDIISHIISHTISSNLYYAILKELAVYIKQTYPNTDNSSINNYENKIYKLLESVLNFNYGERRTSPDVRLQKYIMEESPILIVKFVLKIYSGEFDEHKDITSIDSIFGSIVDILKANRVMPISHTSPLITNLYDYVFPYYKDLFQECISKARVLIDNYNRYIVNNTKYIVIIDSLLSKALDEL